MNTNNITTNKENPYEDGDKRASIRKFERWKKPDLKWQHFMKSTIKREQIHFGQSRSGC